MQVVPAPFLTRLFRAFRDRQGPPERPPYTPYIEPRLENGLWVGDATLEGGPTGLRWSSENEWWRYPLPDGLVGESVQRIQWDDVSHVWVGEYADGLWLYDQEEVWRPFSGSHSDLKRVHHVLWADRIETWVGTDFATSNIMTWDFPSGAWEVLHTSGAGDEPDERPLYATAEGTLSLSPAGFDDVPVAHVHFKVDPELIPKEPPSSSAPSVWDVLQDDDV